MTRRRKYLAAAAAIAILAILLHAPLLRGLAGFLVTAPTADEADYIGVLDWWNAPDGDRSYDTAARLLGGTKNAKAFRGILVVEFQPGRLEQIGAVPTFVELTRRELTARGVPQRAVSVLHSDACGDWSTARALSGWLRERPDATIVLLCDQFRSAHLRYALDRVLDSTQSQRVRVHPLPDRRYDATNWWKSRCGFRAFGFAWLIRIHGWLYGDTAAQPLTADADGYERRYLKTIEYK
jgi:hypothetical protein